MTTNADAVKSPVRADHHAPARKAVKSHPAQGVGSAGGATFRPDIEGLRAIAVGLVLLYHGYAAPFTGGFIGVDVFFVISGFLITSLLLREQTKTGRVSILGFYARRVRRILPASALVVVLTVVASYYFLGFIAGNGVAADAKWTAVFAANIHFGLLNTNYLGSQLPPSPLLHMWSLGVEEQFYVVWPGLFLLLIVAVRGARHRSALATTLFIVVVASFSWSIFQTTFNATWAYFSPLTRAGELALGALVAVLAPTIARLRPAWISELLTLCGLIGIVASALVIGPSTAYPGSAMGWPVIATALVITAGCANVRTAVGRLLALRPMQWLGARSYSLYLWHWPLLAIAGRYDPNPLSRWQVSGLLVVAVVASALSYRLVENPIRRARFLKSRTGLSLAIGAALIVGTVAVAQCYLASHYGSWNPFETVGASSTSDY
jgi:peptidoglycan/LPS O-acetylase OafA/YrhL